MRNAVAAIAAILSALALSTAAFALTPPPEGMLEQMEREGTLEQAKQFARELGTYELKAPKRGALVVDDYSPWQLAEMIKDNFGRSLKGKSSSSIAKSTSQELAWVELDLNYDRVVDERDLLALGHPRPKASATLPSLGTMYYFTLIIDFPDDPDEEGDQSYPGFFTHDHFDDMLFGDGQDGTWYRGLNYYYDQSSYSQLDIQGEVYGWYTAEHPRSYYHPNDNESYPGQTGRRQELMWEAITAADDAGADFSQYDNDGDGVIDEFAVIWTGPHGAWASFWWGYHTGWNGTQYIDGVRLGNYSWQWERYYGFNEDDPPEPSHFSTTTIIHETGHGLGLPDWYDYDGDVGPDGGVGGLDIMHGNCDHSCYNKYLLGWINPDIAYGNLDDYSMGHSTDNQDALIFMPGFDPVSPWTEFFMAQVRKDVGIDQPAPGDGILLWHVDATINEKGQTLYNNSYTDHKQLRLMEADGLEEIETGNHQADADDYYDGTDELSPTSTPNSDDYNGDSTGITVDDCSAIADTMTADFTLYTGNPPTVSIDAPATDSTVSGTTTVTVTASDDSALDYVQLLSGGILLHQWDTFSGTESFSWNTLTEFNGDLTLTARAYDDGGQASSDTITVTVSNTGVTSQSDDFETDLSLWRNIHHADQKRGQYSQWELRASPGSPTPLGTGNEAYVAPLGDAGDVHYCWDDLRSQRLDLSGFTYPLHVQFYYRSGGSFTLHATTDNGATWTELDTIASTNNWATFNRTYDLGTGHAYLEFRFRGDVESDSQNSRGANIDDFSVEQATSFPPTVSFTSHADGDTVGGNVTFTAEASDDTAVGEVKFYVRGGHVRTDSEAPYTYTRDTVSDDNHPGIVLKVIAFDEDGLSSEPDTITLVWYNERPFPVYDDVEDGDGNWSYWNNSRTPNWQLDTTYSFSGANSIGWIGTMEASNTEGVYYRGDPPTSGRHCIDLANVDCIDPVVRFMMHGDGPSSLSSGLYLQSTWESYMWIGGWYGDTTGFEPSEISLASKMGHSGRLLWYMWSGDGTDGTGIWLDDVVVDNDAHIDAVTPTRAQLGGNLTITGQGFGPAQLSSRVVFPGSGEANPSYTVSWSSTQIEVTIPPGSTSGNLKVVCGGDDSESYPVTIVTPPPVLDDIEQIQ